MLRLDFLLGRQFRHYLEGSQQCLWKLGGLQPKLGLISNVSLLGGIK